jgi:hypothetical protein
MSQPLPASRRLGLLPDRDCIPRKKKVAASVGADRDL